VLQPPKVDIHIPFRPTDLLELHNLRDSPKNTSCGKAGCDTDSTGLVCDKRRFWCSSLTVSPLSGFGKTFEKINNVESLPPGLRPGLNCVGFERGREKQIPPATAGRHQRSPKSGDRGRDDSLCASVLPHALVAATDPTRLDCDDWRFWCYRNKGRMEA
jgi:hypothetical protein